MKNNAKNIAVTES